MSEATKGRQGFASMPEADRIRIAAMGGRAAHKNGTAHEWTAEEARRAGMKGGRKAAEARQARGQEAR